MKEACIKMGGEWIRLWMCQVCGKGGCCDLVPRRHETAHFRETSHPIMRSIELGES